jgi:uncharacterized phage protein gp47/JayE
VAQIGEFVVKDATEIRDDILRVIKNGCIARGVANPNVLPDSDFYVLATALGNELAVVGANAIIKADAQMPDTATGDDLARIGNIVSKAKQGAVGSVGSIVIECSAASPVPTRAELIDSAGLKYEVVTGGSYDDGDSVPIKAVDVGAATNHEEGDVLKWSSAPPFCSDQVQVGVGGLVNGNDEDTDETFRARVIAPFQVPPGSGNWEHDAEITEQSSGHVQKAFVYPAVEGPATTDIVVTAAPTATNKSREVDSSVMSGAVVPFVTGALAEHQYITTTTVTDTNADVAFGLILPEAPTANPPGPGGGWTNGTPWPAPDATTAFRCTVTGVTNTTVFTVDALTAPTIGVTRIAWVSPTTWTLFTALVTAVSGISGAYTITLDKPFTGIATGCYIWPEAANAQAYVDATLAIFALMGPGEKTGNASALIRGFRHPPPSTSWPYSLGGQQLRALVNAGDEVESAEYMHRTDGTSTVTGTGGLLTPQVPAAIADPPLQYIPRHIAFYRVP